VRLPLLPPSGAEPVIDRLAALTAAAMKGDAAPPLPDYGCDYGSEAAAAWRPAGLAPEEWGQQGGQQRALPWCGPSGGDARIARLCAMLDVTGDCSRGWGLVASHVRRLHLKPGNRCEPPNCRLTPLAPRLACCQLPGRSGRSCRERWLALAESSASGDEEEEREEEGECMSLGSIPVEVGAGGDVVS